MLLRLAIVGCDAILDIRPYYNLILEIKKSFTFVCIMLFKEVNLGAGALSVTVKATGCGFD